MPTGWSKDMEPWHEAHFSKDILSAWVCQPDVRLPMESCSRKWTSCPDLPIGRTWLRCSVPPRCAAPSASCWSRRWKVEFMMLDFIILIREYSCSWSRGCGFKFHKLLGSFYVPIKMSISRSHSEVQHYGFFKEWSASYAKKYKNYCIWHQLKEFYKYTWVCAANLSHRLMCSGELKNKNSSGMCLSLWPKLWD